MSFSEMMESGRGPGLIGMMLALAVMAIFGMLFIFAFDDDLQGGGKTIESVISDQARDISDLKNAISEVEGQLTDAPVRKARSSELATLERQSQKLVVQIDSLQNAIKSANEGVESAALDFETYKEKYRAVTRANAKGETIDRFEDREGNIYEKVTIREVTPIGIQIIYDGGLKRIQFEQLPDAMIERFQFDAGQKKAALANEEVERQQHEVAVESAKLAKSKEMEQKRKDEAEARKQSMVRGIASKQSRINSMQQEIRSLEQAIRSEGDKPISRAPQMRIQLAKKQKELDELMSELARMHSEVSQ